ncbi:N-acetylmuramoyl-L-alanine amidase [Halorubellus litoreus]|uniref:N-acetylmuramoyl-L-alanine amidase n=1 Tax=Halorubellus litoreus TaxID=755308 RepID=A0ABD5VFM0_9EURY
MRRRRFLQTSTGAVAAGTLLGAAGSAAATDKPAMEYVSAHYSNYTSASRDASDLRWIVVHTIEGSASSGINWFQNPDANVSSHFVVDDDGTITQMVDLEDVAWTQGNGPYNDTGISIEMSGYANSTDFTEAKYQAVADLCAWLCDAYDIPVRHPAFDIAPCSAYDGDGGLIGHDQVPSPYDCSAVTGGKVDPGSTWDWEYLLAKMDGATGGGFPAGEVVKTTSTVNARSAPEIADNVVHTNPEGVRGVVKNGPTKAAGYTWYEVAYENGVVGWAVAKYHTDQAGVTFLHDQRVATTADLVVHDDHALDAPDVWTAPEGSAGYVRAGPQTADGYTWWRVAFNSGQTGWCAGEYLDAAPVDGHGVGHGDDGADGGDGDDGADGGDGDDGADGGEGDDGGSDPTFAEGDTVHATTSLNTRKQPGTGEELVETVSSGATAEVVNGPVDADGYTWWGLHWQAANVWGWSVEQYLDAGGGGNEPSTDFDVETDLTVPVDVTGQEIDDAIAAERPDSPLVGLGDAFVAAQEEYGVNAVYQAAHAIHESAWGTSTIAQDKRNVYGWGAVDSSPYEGAKPFESFEACVDYVMGEVADRYLEPGNWRYNGPTLDGMNVYYATDDRWDVKIAGHYRTLAENI